MAGSRQDIAYLNDIQDVATTPASAVNGNVPVFGPNHTLTDSGKKPADFIEQSELDAAVQSATAEIWNAVNSTYALAAYVSDPWESDTPYAVGAYCRNGNSGYRCLEAHVSGASFDATKWRLVMTPAGKSAIDALLEAYSKDGLAQLIDLAPAYNGSRNYTVGQLAVKDSVLQICTTAGRGPLAVFSRDATIEASIAQRIAAVAETVPETVSDLPNDANYVSDGAIDAEYNTTSHGYSIGDTCAHDGKFYVCRQNVAQGAAWSASDWTEKTFKEIVSVPISQVQADWNEDDVTDPAFIRNKPDVPEVDSTLTQTGAAADAKAVGDALSGVLTMENVPFRIANLIPTTSADPNVVVFQLQDRTVNVISATVEDGKSILLKPPSQPSSSVAGVVLAREFYVVLNIASSLRISVSVQRSSVQDAYGNSVALSAPNGSIVTFRLVDSDRNSSIFIISGYGDAAHSSIAQINQALDEILQSGGAGVFTPGLFLPDEQGKYHQVSIVTDAETGEKNLGVEQRGVN